MAFSKIIEIATGRENASHTPLRHAPQRVEKTEFPAAGDFVEIGSPDMPAALRRFDPPAQERQPQAGIKLPMEKETLLTIRFGFGNNRLRQRSLIRPERESQRRTRHAQAIILTGNHKLTSVGIPRCQFIIEEP